jgi:hypothetical protein
MRAPLLFATLVTLAAVTTACSRETACAPIVTSKTPVVHDPDPDAVAIAQGAAYAVEPFIAREEIEGASIHPVDDARADDGRLVQVSRTTREYYVRNVGSPDGRAFVLLGLEPGATTLRLYRDGDEVGSLPVVVVAQEP